MTEQQLLAL